MKQSIFEKNTAGTSCTRSISGLDCRYSEYSQYFGVLYYCGYFGARSISGFATAVDTPCASSISRFYTADNASTGSISNVGSVRTARFLLSK